MTMSLPTAAEIEIVPGCTAISVGETVIVQVREPARRGDDTRTVTIEMEPAAAEHFARSIMRRAASARSWRDRKQPS